MGVSDVQQTGVFGDVVVVVVVVVEARFVGGENGVSSSKNRVPVIINVESGLEILTGGETTSQKQRQWEGNFRSCSCHDDDRDPNEKFTFIPPPNLTSLFQSYYLLLTLREREREREASTTVQSCTVKSRFDKSRFNIKSRFKVQNYVTKIEFHIKTYQFREKSRFKESKCADRSHSLSRDCTVLVVINNTYTVKSRFNEWCLSAHFYSLHLDFSLNWYVLMWNSTLVTRFATLNRDCRLNRDSLSRDFTVLQRWVQRLYAYFSKVLPLSFFA